MPAPPREQALRTPKRRPLPSKSAIILTSWPTWCTRPCARKPKRSRLSKVKLAVALALSFFAFPGAQAFRDKVFENCTPKLIMLINARYVLLFFLLGPDIASLCNSIGPESCNTLVKLLVKNPNIRRLDLSQNALTDFGTRPNLLQHPLTAQLREKACWRSFKESK